LKTKDCREKKKTCHQEVQLGEREDIRMQYLAALRNLAATCKFVDLDVRLQDQFIFGPQSESSQRKLFTKDDKMALKAAVSIAQAHELSEASTSVIRGSDQSLDSPNAPDEVHRVSKNKGSHPSKQHRSTSDKGRHYT